MEKPKTKQSGHTNKQKIDGSHINVVNVQGDNVNIQQNTQEEKEPSNYERSKNTPFPMQGFQIKNIWLGITGAIGLVSNLLGIWSALGLNVFGLITLVGGVLLLALFLLLSQKPYFSLPFLFDNFSIEKDKEGFLYLTKITDKCLYSYCQSPLETRTIKESEGKIKTKLVCTKNPEQHNWEFDWVKLGDVGEDYRQRKSQS